MPADRRFLECAVGAAFPGAELEHLGTGGFASTFRVSRDSEDLAVKMLDPNLTAVVRSEREERALALVDHPNVVGYRGVGEIECEGRQVRFLVMEFVEGKRLSQSLEDGDSWTLEQVVQLARDLIAGASAIWAAQLAHRDLTPNNLMLRPDGSAVIVDLGIARHLDLDSVTVLPTPGSPGWMSPEQVGLDPEHGDWRSDQFVIGLVLYLLATGLVPYTADNLEDLWRAPAVQELRPPQAVNPEVPSLLSNLIQQMTAREPYQRFLRADALANAVELAAAQVGGTGTTPAAASAVSFGLAQATLKTFAADPYYTDLAAGFIALDARCMNVDKAQELAGRAEHAASLRVLDPVNYFDRSPVNARPAGYQSISYGDGAPRTGFSDESERSAYATPIIEYQLAVAVDAVIAPYFYATPAESIWLRESLGFARVTTDLLAERGDARPVWAAAAIAATFLRPAQLSNLLNILTGAAPTTLYLLIHTGQAPNAPLADVEVLRGLRTVIDTLRTAGTDVIVGRRFTEGLLLCALGAAGWTTGVSATHQDFQPHPETADDERGGRGLDWYYVPALLNSISIPRRAALHASFPVLAPTTRYATDLFSANPSLAEIGNDSAARNLLHQHNIYAVREQTAELARTAPNLRVATLRRWVTEATEHYAKIGGPWHAAERPAFLDEWLRVL